MENRIELNPAVMLGKPVIKGTRITVQNIIDELAAGYSIEDIITAHPRIQKEDILAAFQYVSEVMKNEKIYTITS